LQDKRFVRDDWREETAGVNRSRRNVELIDLIVDDDDFSDVGTRRPSGQGWVWALVVGTVAMVVVAGVIAGGSNQVPLTSLTTPPTATAQTATTLAVGSTSTSIGRPSPIQPDTTSPQSGVGVTHIRTDVGGPARPFGRDTGLVVYLARSAGRQDKLLVYDIDRGRIIEVDLGVDVGWFVRAMGDLGGVLVDGGDVLRITANEVNAVALAANGNYSYFDSPYGRLAPGPGHGMWLRTKSPSGLVLLDEVGKPAGVGYELPGGAVLYGSLADGRPVVRGADQRSLVIDPDGSHALLADGPTSFVEHGRFIETICDDALRCSNVAHVESTIRTLGPVTTGSDTTLAYRFQPDGSLVAIVRDRELSILDVDTGELRANLLYGIGENGSGDNGSGDNGLLTSSIAFLPGGTGLVATTSFGVQLLDLAGHLLATVDLPHTDGTQEPLLLGIGLANELSDG
jgi:hypothetical protein